MNLPNLELLLLRVVLALPKASKIGLAFSNFDSVLPAPDSPETMMDCDCFKTFMSRKALSAMANTWGGIVPNDLPWYDLMQFDSYNLGPS